MHSIILTIIFVIIVINIIRAAQKSSGQKAMPRTNRRMWSETAFQHNLNLFPPDGNSPFPSMRGMIDGLYTEVWGDFDTAGRALLFCRVEYALSLPFHLCIVKGPMEKEPAGSEFEIKGISAENVTVSASDSKELQHFLNQQNINTLKNCIGIYHAVKISDTFLVLASTNINDAISFSSFLERAVSAAKTLSGGHSVLRSANEFKPIAPVEDSVELELPEDQQKNTFQQTFAAVVPMDEPPEEIVTKPARTEIPEPVKIQEQIKETEPVKVQEQIKETEPVKMQEQIKEMEPEQTVDLTEQSLSEALFSAAFPGEKEKALFQTFSGKTVQWSGVLKSAYPYSSDFVFGKGPGTKATFEIAEISSGYGMKNKIKATVSLGEETLELLKGKNGTVFQFTGTLLKFEPFSKEILIDKGSLLLSD